MSTRLRHRRNQQGFSLIELLIVIAIILLILSFAIPQMNKARMNAQETGAIVALRTIHDGEIQYYSQFGQYATLAQLGPPSAAGGAEGPASAGLIPASLASGSNGGYNYTVVLTPAGYAVTAVPKVFNSTGRRSFFADQSGVTHENWGAEPATAQSPELSK